MNEIFTLFQSTSTQIFINHRVGENNFTMDKPGKHQLNQVNKKNITSDETIKIVSSNNIQWEQCHIFDHPSKNARPESNHGETAGKSKWKNILQSICPIILKSFRSWKKRLRKELLETEGDERYVTLNATHDSELNPFAIYNIIETNGKIWVGYEHLMY